MTYDNGFCYYLQRYKIYSKMQLMNVKHTVSDKLSIHHDLLQGICCNKLTAI